MVITEPATLELHNAELYDNFPLSIFGNLVAFVSSVAYISPVLLLLLLLLLLFIFIKKCIRKTGDFLLMFIDRFYSVYNL